MGRILYKEYQLSDLSNLIIKSDDGGNECNHRIEIVLLIMARRKQYCLSLYISDGYNPISDIPISYGTIKQKDGIVYLNDALSGIQIILREKDSNTLSCCMGFYFLVGKEFVYQSTDFRDEEYFLFDCDEGMRKRVKREHLYEREKSEEPVPLQLGVYGHMLFLDMNFRYQQFFDTGCGFRCLISKGIWEKKGNTLKLYDPDLKYSFLLLVKNEDLVRVRYQEDVDLYFLLPTKDQMYPFLMR